MTERSDAPGHAPAADDWSLMHALRTRWQRRERPSYWLTRFVLLRLLGFVYLVAFLKTAQQIVPLVGADGLTPVGLFLERVAAVTGSRAAGFLQLPSLFWFGHADPFMTAVAWTGVALSLVVLLGYANALLMGVLWALYFSFVSVGQSWFGYGWEILLLETGFLAAFLCPLLDGRPFPRRAPPEAVIWLFRWLIVRIMLGAGLIKLRGDECWLDLTCLFYHFETQPLPNPLSRAFHLLPRGVLKAGVLWNHVVELVVPPFAFGPRRVRHVAGVLLASLQGMLILSGNLSFLNWLTLVPIVACFDDSLLRRVLPRRLVARAEAAARDAQPSRPQQITVRVLVAVVAVLSVAPVANLLSSRQLMNTSFTPLKLVNTYGAFGGVGRDRYTLVFEGTADTVVTDTTRWRPYLYPCQPVELDRRPCVVAPYQPHLDWQIWFAAMGSPERYPWTLNLVWKLLHNDPEALRLMANDPFPEAPPRHVRVVRYLYEFAPQGNSEGLWWQRTPVDVWLPPLSADDPELRRFLVASGWLPESEGRP